MDWDEDGTLEDAAQVDARRTLSICSIYIPLPMPNTSLNDIDRKGAPLHLVPTLDVDSFFPSLAISRMAIAYCKSA